MDLVGSLRHTQLRAAGAPTLESEITSDVRLKTGTMWHELIGEFLVRAGVPVMREVDVTPWLPDGWGGTADWLFWAPEYRAFVLGDLKTSKGEAMKWVISEGAKDEHLWQLSAYFYALVKMGLPIVRGFAVMYLPMNDTTDKTERVEPQVMECDPLPEDEVHDRMASRWEATQEYLSMIVEFDKYGHVADLMAEPHERYLNKYLAPPQERVQKVFWASKTQTFDVKLVPHWSTDYCPFPNELCDCSEQGTTKIGHYKMEDGGDHTRMVYVPRKGFENVDPLETPSSLQVKRRWKEVNA